MSEEIKRKEVPAFIKNKLYSIYQHQLAVKKLIKEIETWAPELDNNYDPDTLWSFAMNVDQQGQIFDLESSVVMLDRFLNDYKP